MDAISNVVCNINHYRIVYDAEAIFALREIQKATILSSKATKLMGEKQAQTLLKKELELARKASAVVVVSEHERAVFAKEGIRNIHVLGHAVSPEPTLSLFENRDIVLFIGAMHGYDNPNLDSMIYFCNDVWPKIRKNIDSRFVIAGYDSTAEKIKPRLKYAFDDIDILGEQSNLAPLYERARVFVIPTRYAAGIPLKAHEAAARGVPMVVTPLIADQLGWKHGEELLVGTSADSFAEAVISLYTEKPLWSRVRDRALERVMSELNITEFHKKIDQIIAQVALENNKAT
jgi:glycosyltransferase involved in cell wall biosynthesis